MSTFWHALLGLDEDGQPADADLLVGRPAGGGRGGPAARRARRGRDPRRTGCRLHSSYWPAKLAWLREREPDLRRARAHLDLSPASTSSGGCGRRGGEHLDGLGHRAARPAHLHVGRGADARDRGAAAADRRHPRSGLTNEWAERWPGLREVPWFPAWGDGACSNLGSGCGTLERAALMVGTSGALRVLWRTEEVPGGHARPVALPGRRPARRGRRVAVGRRQRLRLAAPPHPPARGRRGGARDRGDGARCARADRTAAAVGRARPGLERRGGGDGRRPHAGHRAAGSAAREPRGGRAALPPDRARAERGAAGRARWSARRRARQSPAWTQIMADALGRPVDDVGGRRGLEPRRRAARARGARRTSSAPRRPRRRWARPSSPTRSTRRPTRRARRARWRSTTRSHRCRRRNPQQAQRPRDDALGGDAQRDAEVLQRRRLGADTWQSR